MTILIAEDDSSSRRLLEGTVTRWGYTASLACNGTEAWEKLQQSSPPALLILDWQMVQRSHCSLTVYLVSRHKK